MAQRLDFYLLPFGRYWGKKNGKKRETENSPPHHFSRSTGQIINKLIIRKCFLCLPLLESKRIFFIQSFAEIWTISWGTHLERFPNHFINNLVIYTSLFRIYRKVQWNKRRFSITSSQNSPYRPYCDQKVWMIDWPPSSQSRPQEEHFYFALML